MGIKSKKVYVNGQDPVNTYTKIVGITYGIKNNVGHGIEPMKFIKTIHYDVYDEKNGKKLYSGGAEEDCTDELENIYTKGYNKLKTLESFKDPVDA